MFCLEVDTLGLRLELFTQAEHADQVFRRGMRQQRLHRTGFGRRRFVHITVVLLPEIDDRVRGRIVLRARTLGDLLLRLRGDVAAQEAVGHEVLCEGQGARRRGGSEHAAGRVPHDARRHGFVGEAELLCLLRVNGLAREHQVKRGRRADQLRQAFDTTPRRQDAKHHFGQAHARAGIVDRHTVAAGHCQLQAATHAEALDQGKGRVFHDREAVVEVVAGEDQFGRCGNIVGFADSLELLNVGAGDEAGRLQRMEHHTLRRLRVKFVKQPGQLGQHRRAHRVDVAACHVDADPDDALLVGTEFEVFVSHVNSCVSQFCSLSLEGRGPGRG